MNNNEYKNMICDEIIKSALEFVGQVKKLKESDLPLFVCQSQQRARTKRMSLNLSEDLARFRKKLYSNSFGYSDDERFEQIKKIREEDKSSEPLL